LFWAVQQQQKTATNFKRDDFFVVGAVGDELGYLERGNSAEGVVTDGDQAVQWQAGYSWRASRAQT